MRENTEGYLESIPIRKRAVKLDSELNRWTEILKNDYSAQKIIIFGSFANGKISRWSDIDLVIIKDTEKSFLDRIKEVFLLLHPQVGVDILVYTPQEFKSLSARRIFFQKEINAKGITIYERGS